MAGVGVCTVSSDGPDVLETVARVNGRLVAGEEGADAVLESLRQLQAVSMTFPVQEATKIGRAVNALRKSAPSEQARGLAASLYRGWKALAYEHLRSLRRSRPPVFAPAAGVSAADAPESSARASSKPPKSSPKTPKAAESVRSLLPVKATGSSPKTREAAESVRSSLPVKAKPADAPADSSAWRNKEKVPRSSSQTATIKKQRSKLLGDAPSGMMEQRSAVVARQLVVQHISAHPKTAPGPSNKPTRSNIEASPPATTSPDPETLKAAANKRAAPPPSAASASKKAKLLAQPPQKPSGSSCAGNKRKEPSTSVEEARLERVKRRLHESYQEATAAKEKRRIQVIDASETAAPSTVHSGRAAMNYCRLLTSCNGD